MRRLPPRPVGQPGEGGVEGGGIYEIASALRDGAPGIVDLAPDLDMAALARRLSRPRGRLSIGNWLRRALGDPVRVALLLEWGRPLPEDPAALARRMVERHRQGLAPAPLAAVAG